MLVRNFQALEGMGSLMPSDYVNYLKAVTNRNQLIKSPQLHAVISCKEKEKDRHELTDLAQKWLEEMGYGDNPYMLIFHKDTKNNHIHIVSSRVNKQAKLIDTGFTYIKAIKVLNQLTGLNEQRTAENDLKLALAYQFSSAAQFGLVLQSLGYSCVEKDSKITLYRFGRKMIEVDTAVVKQRIAEFYFDRARAHDIKVMIDAYKRTLDPAIYKKSSFYRRAPRSKVFTSSLTEELYQRSGLQFFFHAQPGQKPAEFTIVDHASARVFGGAEVMPFRALITPGKEMPISTKGLLPETAERGAWVPFELSIADDVDDEAVFGKGRHGKKDMSQELTR
jgi:hypothetical protein